jgi:hypothetical protein
MEGLTLEQFEVNNMEKPNQNIKNIPSQDVSKERDMLRVGIVCPSCNAEVGFNEIIEKKGAIGCVNCVK